MFEVRETVYILFHCEIAHSFKPKYIKSYFQNEHFDTGLQSILTNVYSNIQNLHVHSCHHKFLKERYMLPEKFRSSK